MTGKRNLPRGRVLRLFRLGVMGARFLPTLVTRPGLLLLALRGAHLGPLLKLDAKWIRAARINTVLDIGANTGQFASAIHGLLPGARIYSFEPLVDCYQVLARRLSGARRFQAFNVALGAKEGNVTFHRNDFTASSSVLPITALHSTAFPWTAETAPVTVEMRSLDSFLPDLVLESKVLVKIDVQGYEDQVLLGGESVIRAASYVLIETSFEPLYEGQASFETIYAIMTEYGFRYSGSIDQLVSPVDGRILQADALFAAHQESDPA